MVMRRKRILLLPLLAVTLISGTAVAAPGDPYVVYTANSFSTGAVVLRTEPGTGSLVEVSRNGPQGNLFQRPYDLAVEPGGQLVVADLGEPNRKDGAVIRVDPLTGVQSLVSSGGEFFDPAGIAVAPDGWIYVVDNRAPDNDGAVIRVDPRTGAQTLVTERSSRPGRRELDLPFGIAIERDGNLVVSNRESPAPLPVLCQVLGKVVRVDPVSGNQVKVSGAGHIAWPLGVAVAPDGRIVVANECGAGGGLVLLDGPAQRVLTPNGSQDVLVTPERVAFDPGGRLLVSDFGAGPDGEGGIVSVDPDTGAQSLVRSGELFNHPLGIAVVVNRPPWAALALPPAVAAGREVRLDASRSGDPERLPLVYEWDLDGDGGFEAGSGGTATASRSFANHGPATVRVRVRDPHGGSAVAEASVMVDGAAPVIGDLRRGASVLAVKRPRKRSRGQARPRRPAAKRPRAAATAPRATRAAATQRRRPRPPRATTVRFSLTEPAAVTLAVDRARRGRRAVPGGPCKPGARTGRTCLVWSRARSIAHAGAAGENAIRLRSRGLRPGLHRIVLSAVDAVGNASAPRMAPLRVVPEPKRPAGRVARSALPASGRPSPPPRSTSPRPSSRPPEPACRRPCPPLTPSSRGTGCRPC
jgi:DNA-binding beta-propeller fold protein YncE